MKGPVLLLTACVVLTTASVARGQADSQLWANVTMDRVHGDHTTFTVDVEPKVLLDAPTDTPGWWNIDLTSGVEQTLTPWLDGSAEVATGYTRQTDDLNSVELTPRAGVRLHLFSRGLPILRSPDRPPRRRLVIRDLVRVEGRTLFYTGAGSGSSSQLRFRNRVEFVLPLNRSRTTEPGAWNLLADWESFIPLGDPAERFSNRQRIRVGVGTRRDG